MATSFMPLFYKLDLIKYSTFPEIMKDKTFERKLLFEITFSLSQLEFKAELFFLLLLACH